MIQNRRLAVEPNLREQKMICKICGSSDVYELYSNSIFCICHCKTCDFKHKENAEAYDFNKMVYEDNGWIDDRDKSKSRWRRSRKKGLQSFKKYLLPGSFVEIGPGDGWYLKHALDNGYKPIGIETSKRNVEYIERTHGIKCFHGRLEDANLEKDSIDNVLISHLIEHIQNPKELILNIRDILKPQGRLIIFTPNAASYTERLFGADNSFYNTFDHLSFFSPKSITHLARITELEVKTIFTREAYFDLNNKLTTYMKIKLTGRRCHFVERDVDEGKIDVYSNSKVYSTVLAMANAVRSSSIVWGQPFKIFGLLGIGAQLRCVLIKK